MELQTMPLRFRIWDDVEKCLGCIPGYRISIALDLLDGRSNEEDSRYIISQDTGITDKNGNSIYTGDILIVTATGGNPKFNTPVIVGYYQQLVRIVNAEETHNEWLGEYCEYELEIIGNIWQNPELLEKHENSSC